MTRLGVSTVWRLNGGSLKSRFRITKAVAWATVLYGCDSWTISQKSMKRLQVFERKCYRRLLNIILREKKTNECVMERVIELKGGRPESVEEIVKRRKLKYFGHQIRKEAMVKVMIEGKIEG